MRRGKEEDGNGIYLYLRLHLCLHMPKVQEKQERFAIHNKYAHKNE